MSENRWNPPPPPQTGLWGQWATHMIAQHQTRIHAAEQEQLEQGREMERRRLLMEARMSSGILRLLKRHLPRTAIGIKHWQMC